MSFAQSVLYQRFHCLCVVYTQHLTHTTSQTITLSREWERLHFVATRHLPCPATAVATCGVTITTGGEDGRINLLNPDSHTPLRTIGSAPIRFRGCHVYISFFGVGDVSLLERCPHFRGCYVQASMELRPEDVSLLERCPHFRGCYVQASMELGPEDVSLLERCPHLRGCYVQASMELGPEHVSLLK